LAAASHLEIADVKVMSAWRASSWRANGRRLIASPCRAMPCDDSGGCSLRSLAWALRFFVIPSGRNQPNQFRLKQARKPIRSAAKERPNHVHDHY
jgi:hypothetical protein